MVAVASLALRHLVATLNMQNIRNFEYGVEIVIVIEIEITIEIAIEIGIVIEIEIEFVIVMEI